MADFDEAALSLLDARLKSLEERVVGNSNLDEIPEDEDIISSLASLGGKLGNALSTRDRMMMVMKRLDELERYLDPSYAESSQLPDSAKLDLILAREEELRDQYQQLNMVMSLKNFLDSEQIADVVNLKEGLAQSWKNNYALEESVSSQNAKTMETLENYNAIINSLTETFIKMDTIVRKAEEAAQPKKPLD